MRDQISRVGICNTGKCRTENAGMENAGPKIQAWKNAEPELLDQSSSSSFYFNQTTWPINMNKGRTDRQINSIK